MSLKTFCYQRLDLEIGICLCRHNHIYNHTCTQRCMFNFLISRKRFLNNTGMCNTEYRFGVNISNEFGSLSQTFSLQGVEIRYELYNPRIQSIEVLKLEKRLDDNLMYLRDALPEYSTFDMNMKPVSRLAHEEIPVNKVRAVCFRAKVEDHLSNFRI